VASGWPLYVSVTRTSRCSGLPTCRRFGKTAVPTLITTTAARFADLPLVRGVQVRVDLAVSQKDDAAARGHCGVVSDHDNSPSGVTVAPSSPSCSRSTPCSGCGPLKGAVAAGQDTPERLDAACAKAIAVGDPSYRTIKGILLAGTETLDISGSPD